MNESSEGVPLNPESTAKPFVPSKIELTPIQPLNESARLAPELRSPNVEEQRKEPQQVNEFARDPEKPNPSKFRQENTFVSDHSPSLAQRVSNFFADTRLRAVVWTNAKTWGAVIGTKIITSVIGHPEWAVYAAIPILIYTGREAGKAVLGGGIPLGQFTTLFKEYAVQTKVTPVGTIQSGELVGSLHLANSLGKMSDFSARGRALAVPLDALRGLDKLREKFEQDSQDVKGIAAVKASSHLVAQNRELFKSLGFTLQDQSEPERNSISNKLAGKILIPPIWGIRQLFREGSLRGFREANRITLGEIQTAWITPQTLCSAETRIAIDQKIKRIEPILDTLRTRGTAI